MRGMPLLQGMQCSTLHRFFYISQHRTQETSDRSFRIARHSSLQSLRVCLHNAVYGSQDAFHLYRMQLLL